MNSAMWTLLVLIFIPNTFILGFVIYLLMREPLPYPCPQCSNTVGARFNFCPNCKCNLHPSCSQCKHEIAESDKFCPLCGNDVTIKSADLAPEIASQLPQS
jgi:RNA polymerase subunit RPABC4/transcription elongation factor Spt4